jgi:hypothetical protein
MDKYRSGVGHECMECKAYAGPPDPGFVEQDICETCAELDAEEDE